MALTRKMLKAMGLEESVIDSIIDAHSETVEALKKQRDDAQAEAGKVEDLTRQLNEANTKLSPAGDAAKVQADFDAFRQQVENEKREAAETADVLAICKDAGITRDSFLRAVGREFDRSKIQRGEDGTISNREALVDYVKKDFADFGSTTVEQGTPPINPPAGGYKGMTKEQIGAITDTAERRAAIAANLDLFN